MAPQPVSNASIAAAASSACVLDVDGACRASRVRIDSFMAYECSGDVRWGGCGFVTANLVAVDCCCGAPPLAPWVHFSLRNAGLVVPCMRRSSRLIEGMTTALDLALQRALAIRLNLQISLSKLPIVQEWMDIHLDRWLEHLPMPPDMPDGYAIEVAVALASDLSRVHWQAWGDPRGFVPRMADYFKLCNIAKSDLAILDQVGEVLMPETAGSWIAVLGKQVVTGWQFVGAQKWSAVESLFGTHEAKFALKKYMDGIGCPDVHRFTQSIGDAVYTEVAVPLPGDSVAERVARASEAFLHFTGAGLDAPVRERLSEPSEAPHMLAVRVRSGKIARVAVTAPWRSVEAVAPLAEAANLPCDAALAKLIGSLGNHVLAVEYGRAGQYAGLDVVLEPTAPNVDEKVAEKSASGAAN